MRLQRKTICDECKKDNDGLMKCTFADGEEIYLCPDCLKADGDFCLRCGCFASGTEGFDIVHPGYCNSCIEEMEYDDFWNDEYDEWDEDDEYGHAYDDEEFPHGSLDY
jgi:hypothetical protein